jgi:hypothetical protein
VRRLTILLAALAALMLVPAAGAFAENTATVVPLGAGSGEVKSGSALPPPTPPIECAYNGETEETSGECGPSEFFPSGDGSEYFEVIQTAATGSEFVEWLVEGTLFFYCGPGQEKCVARAIEPEEGEEGEEDRARKNPKPKPARPPKFPSPSTSTRAKARSSPTPRASNARALKAKNAALNSKKEPKSR